MFATHGGKKREVVQALSTTEGIAQKFDGKLNDVEAKFRAVLREAPPDCVHLVNSEQLGAYLSAMASELQAPGSSHGPSQANCLLRTKNHAMALHVERKRKFEVEYFSAKLYDPNATAIYRRVLKAVPEDFGNLQVEDMMIHPQLISQYIRGETMPLSMAVVSLDDRLRPTMDRGAVAPSVSNMSFALEFGLLEELHSILKFALQ